MTAGSRDPRRFFRFGLRSLLLLVAFAAVLAGLYRQLVVPYQEQQRFLALAAECGAVVTIQSAGSTDSLLWTPDGKFGLVDRIVEVDFSGVGWRYFQNGTPIETIVEPYAGPGPPDFETLMDLIRNTVKPSSGFGTAAEALSAERSCMSHLASLADLRRLSLSYTSVKDDDLDQLRGLKHLEQLDLRATAVTTSGLRHLAALPNLRNLGLSASNVTDEGLDCLNQLARLETLDLTSTHVTEAGLAAIRLPALRRLYVRCSDATAVTLRDLPELKHLDLACSITRAIHVVNCPVLRSLNLKGTEVDDAGLANLAKLGSLKRLGLSPSRVTGKGLEHLRDLALEEICLDPATIGPTAIESLRKMTSLRIVHLVQPVFRKANVGDECADAQKALQALGPHVTVQPAPGPSLAGFGSRAEGGGGFF
jgi:Leucine Rich repeat